MSVIIRDIERDISSYEYELREANNKLTFFSTFPSKFLNLEIEHGHVWVYYYPSDNNGSITYVFHSTEEANRFLNILLSLPKEIENFKVDLDHKMMLVTNTSDTFSRGGTILYKDKEIDFEIRGLPQPENCELIKEETVVTKRVTEVKYVAKCMDE